MGFSDLAASVGDLTDNDANLVVNPIDMASSKMVTTLC